MAKFIGNILLRGKIECVTGLHIGGSKDKMEIGGVDSPVVRDPNTRLPYIPGSSLKGKMRMLLEFATGNVKDGKVHNCPESDCPVCRVFGSSAAEGRDGRRRTCGPTRLLVRDAYPDTETRTMWESLDSELLYAELKSENFLDRITSVATPRFLERVVKGSKFDLDMIYGVYQIDQYDDLDFFDHVRTALMLLEHSAMGGNGSRGYGRVRFAFAPPVMLSRDDYRTGLEKVKSASVRPGPEAFTPLTDSLKLDEGIAAQWRAASSD